ncbi:hypothetical protein MRX96_058852 [Rhipicephalus microplus]
MTDKAVEVLVDSEYWKNKRFRSYIEAVWLSVKELWVMSYRLAFDVVLTTNNGIEAQNSVLKSQYAKSSSGKRSLTSLIMTVVHGYLPDKEAKFHEAARRQSSAYRQYSENVPAYLHHRPHGKHKYPCKHFCVVFKYNDRWGFSSLPQSYLNRPQITLGSCPKYETSSEIPLVNQPSPSEVSSQDLAWGCSVSELHKSITEELEKCSSLLYCCYDVQTLVEARGLLQATFRKLAESVPKSSGLHIRGSPTKGCSSLKTLPKRRRL